MTNPVVSLCHNILKIFIWCSLILSISISLFNVNIKTIFLTFFIYLFFSAFFSAFLDILIMAMFINILQLYSHQNKKFPLLFYNKRGTAEIVFV